MYVEKKTQSFQTDVHRNTSMKFQHDESRLQCSYLIDGNNTLDAAWFINLESYSF